MPKAVKIRTYSIPKVGQIIKYLPAESEVWKHAEIVFSAGTCSC